MAKKKKVTLNSTNPGAFYKKVLDNKNAGFNVRTVRQAEFRKDLKKRRRKR